MLTTEQLRLTDLAITNYYADELTDETTLNEYLENWHTSQHDDENWTQEDHLTQALGDDMHDLLKNGNDEDLGWSEADVEILRDGDYYAHLDLIARTMARKILGRIYN